MAAVTLHAPSTATPPAAAAAAEYDHRGVPLSALAAADSPHATATNGASGGSSIAMSAYPAATVVPIAPARAGAAGVSALTVANEGERLSFAWEQLRVEVNAPGTPNHERVLLDSVNGIVQPGQLLGIMGPSGSGKTTLLDLLSGRLGTGGALKVSGARYINGRVVDEDGLKHIARYVPQEDHLLGTMTVRETLEFSAALQLPDTMSAADKQRRIDVVMAELGLESCADTPIGTVFQKGISGGQKRRVSMAVELLTLPKVLFLDEPTSGLDSAAAESVVELLWRLAQGGRVVIATIHQPPSAVFARLDLLYLLSRGKPVYFGPTAALVPYLSQPSVGVAVPQYSNPADVALNAINTDFGITEERITALSAVFVASPPHAVVVAGIAAAKAKAAESKQSAADLRAGGGEYATSYLNQFWQISKRTLTDNVRNPGVYWVRWVMYVMLSLMIGGVYVDTARGQKEVQDRISLLFYVAAFMVFMSIAVIPTFISERAVVARERANGWYSEGPYALAGLVCSVPGVFMLALTASVIITFLSTVCDTSDRFGWFLLDLFLSLMAAESFMVLISSIAPIYILGMALGAGMFGMFMLTEGFFQIPSNIPPWFIWAHYWGFHKYTFELFMHTEFHDQRVECDMPVAYINGTGVCRYDSGNAVLESFDMDNVKPWFDAVILLVNIIGYRLIFYCILKFVHKNKK